MHTYNPSTQETKARESLQVQTVRVCMANSIQDYKQDKSIKTIHWDYPLQCLPPLFFSPFQTLCSIHWVSFLKERTQVLLLQDIGLGIFVEMHKAYNQKCTMENYSIKFYLFWGVRVVVCAWRPEDNY